MNPSTQQILDAIELAAAESVVVLPNNKNIVAVAEQAAARRDRPVEVVPSQSVVEALAAMLDFDRRRDRGRQRGADARRRRPASAPARSRRRCATPRATAVRSRRATGSA